MPDPLLLLGFLFASLLLSFWLFRPQSGRYWLWRRRKKISPRALGEDVLKYLHRCQRYSRPAVIGDVAQELGLSMADARSMINDLIAAGHVEARGDALRLTPAGKAYAIRIIRAHRLWERYLAESTGYPQQDWHEKADEAEHTLTPAEVESLAATLGHPTHDPHGDPIPTASGAIGSHGGRPLPAMTPGASLKVVHLEDEPEATFETLVKAKLYPGIIIQLKEVSTEGVRFQFNGAEQHLSHEIARNISVIPWKAPETVPAGRLRLSSLTPGQEGMVTRISPTCRGQERRRFMDLGIVPGTLIAAEMRSPSGDPTAYRIRDTLIALRQEQAWEIEIEPGVENGEQ